MRDAQAKALPLVAIADQPPSPFGGFNLFGVDGTFGPGRYCGNVPRFKITRLANGSRRRTRIGTADCAGSPAGSAPPSA
ncbi:MAG: hypothetical protein M3417_05200 [Actinomycetota bacterium]|nr:hypothetical protein [Actinomycetota bacterium]